MRSSLSHMIALRFLLRAPSAAGGHHKLMAGYDDAPVTGVLQGLDSAAPYPAVTAIMYTTGPADFSNLVSFARIVDAYRM